MKTTPRPLSPPANGRRWRRRGVILVLTLWIVLVLTLLAHSLAFEMIVETKLTTVYRDRLEAELIARRGIAIAVRDLRNDRLIETYDDSPDDEKLKYIPFDALGDVWNDGEMAPRKYKVNNRNEKNKVEGEYEILVVDEESKFGLNNANKSAIDVIRYILIQLDVDEDDAEEIANAIHDWKDPDDIAIGDVSTSEREYYTKLAEDLNPEGSNPWDENKDMPKFLPKNAPFDTVDELLQIPGITPELFYGYNPEETPRPEFFPTRAIEEPDKDALPGLRDLLTVRTSSMNVNTANFVCLAAVLAAVLAAADPTNDDNLDNGRDLAQDIIDHRQNGDDKDIENDDAFRHLDQLSEIEKLAPVIAKIRQVVPLTVSSDSFTIYCRAQTGESKPLYRGSQAPSDQKRPRPTCSIVAECKRKVITIPITLDEDGNEIEMDETLPAYRAIHRPGQPPLRLKPNESSALNDGAARQREAFFAPVVYFKRWNSY